MRTRSLTLTPLFHAAQKIMYRGFAPVMMVASTSKRTPIIPRGSCMPSKPSTTYCLATTSIISRSGGTAMTSAAFNTRSMSLRSHDLRSILPPHRDCSSVRYDCPRFQHILRIFEYLPYVLHDPLHCESIAQSGRYLRLHLCEFLPSRQIQLQ